VKNPADKIENRRMFCWEYEESAQRTRTRGKSQGEPSRRMGDCSSANPRMEKLVRADLKVYRWNRQSKREGLAISPRAKEAEAHRGYFAGDVTTTGWGNWIEKTFALCVRKQHKTNIFTSRRANNDAKPSTSRVEVTRFIRAQAENQGAGRKSEQKRKGLDRSRP